MNVEIWQKSISNALYNLHCLSKEKGLHTYYGIWDDFWNVGSISFQARGRVETDTALKIFTLKNRPAAVSWFHDEEIGT